ncbi:MAG TPA: ferrochelatase [Jatrophihabitans sp.]|uniref:ferrochelatase n=1 Tax=Jatrophihabitans sp. TaxID=1932789 RepID=UPI002F206BB4
MSESPVDSFLLLSFGGPQGPDEVMPFLRNVTAGRGVPDERLEAVAEHYQHFGGVSPITAQNQALLAALGTEFGRRGIDLPLYFGNRNWRPFLTDTARQMAAEGRRHALVLATSATGSYSGCRQYREDLARATAELAGSEVAGPELAGSEPAGSELAGSEPAGAELAGSEPAGGAPRFTKLRHYFDHPGFIAANAVAVRNALAELSPDARAAARLVFTAHSIPVSMNDTAGPAGGLYSAQHRETARLVAETVRGPGADFDLVWQSRSGPPQTPWLEPDVNDHLRTLAAAGVPGVVVAPTGFVSDHLEVLWDLDNEASDTAAELGLEFARASTAGTHPAFVAGLADLVQEQLAARPPAYLGGLGLCGQDCPASCCPAPARRGSPAG